MAETNVTPLKSIKNEFAIVNDDTLKIKNTNKKNSKKLRIPLFNSISSTDWTMVNNSNSSINSSKSTYTFLTLIKLISSIGIISSNQKWIELTPMNLTHLWNYHFVNFTSEFITFTDIQSLGFLLYLVYPFITILLGIILWVVLVGILRISTSS